MKGSIARCFYTVFFVSLAVKRGLIQSKDDTYKITGILVNLNGRMIPILSFRLSSVLLRILWGLRL